MKCWGHDIFMQKKYGDNMKDHTGCKRGFSQLSRAWYGPESLVNSEYVDKANIGFYSNEGGTTGEFSVVWEKLAGNITPKLIAYDDGWNALFKFGDMLEFMAEIDGQDVSPDDFCKRLAALGIEDMTKTEPA
jgi:hypothetical protein